ncbi:metalloregulator ArsR/SmtB family transcription factor [Sphingomonas rosea]
MVHYESPALDRSFAALSDATRRGVIAELARREASISDLAGRFGMTLTGMKKHVAVLEGAGLVATQKVGRVRTCRLGARGLDHEAQWLADMAALFEARFARLDTVLDELKQEEEHGRAND